MQVSWGTGRGYGCPAVWFMSDTVVWFTHSQAFPFLLRKGAKMGFFTPAPGYDNPDGSSAGKSHILRAGQRKELQFLVT